MPHQKQNRALRWVFLLAVFALWMYGFAKIYFSTRHLLPRDNFEHHWPLFGYLVDYLQTLGTVPSWFFSRHGGIWFEPLMNNYLLVAPHRLVATLLALSGLDTVLAYKLGIFVVGEGLFLCGIALFVRKLFGDAWAWFAVALTFFSGVTLTFVHQEHVLGTLFFLPWIGFAFLKARETPAGAIALFALLGLSLNTHYPQLLFGYFGLLGIGWLLSLRKKPSMRFARDHTGLAVSCLLAFLVSASPVIYVYAKYQNKIESPYRGQSGISATNHEAYLKINTPSTSLHPANLPQFLGSDRPLVEVTTFDQVPLYAGVMASFALFLLLTRPIAFRFLHLTVLFGLAWFCTGYYAGASATLWNMLPGIALFRQWYHFAPILSFHFLFVFVLAARQYLRDLQSGDGRIAYLLGWLLFAGLWIGEVLPTPMTLIPSLLCFFLCLRNTPQRFATGLLFGWIAYFTLQTAHQTLSQYEVGLFPKPPLNARDPLERLESHLLRRRAIAQPKGATDFYLLSAGGSVFWKTAKGLRTATRSEVQIYPRGGKLLFEVKKPPEGVYQLVLLQFNDGQWLGPAVTEGPLHTIALPLQKGLLVLERAPTPWPWIVLLSFMPMVTLLSAPLAEWGRKRYRMSTLRLPKGVPA